MTLRSSKWRCLFFRISSVMSFIPQGRCKLTEGIPLSWVFQRTLCQIEKHVSVWCGFVCVGLGKLTLTTTSGIPKKFSRRSEEDLGSEVVSWFDVAHVHEYSLLPVLLRRY